MSKLPALKPQRVLRALGRAGFYVDRTSGSHYLLKHPANPALRVIVPYHNKDLKAGTLLSIIKQADMTIEAFIALL